MADDGAKDCGAVSDGYASSDNGEGGHLHVGLQRPSAVTVQTIGGESWEIEVLDSDDINSFKGKIEAKTGHPPSVMNLMVDGKELKKLSRLRQMMAEAKDPTDCSVTVLFHI